jgi:stage V sporulation protein R
MTTIFDEAIRDRKRLNDGPDWTFELLDVYLAEIDRVAKLYRLDTYPHQIEVITSEQMMDAYSSVGMPINYSHWSFGKKFIETEQRYKHGQQGLQSLHRLPDGREHHDHAGAGDGACLLWPQLFL